MSIFLYIVPLMHYLLVGGLVVFLYQLSINQAPILWLSQKADFLRAQPHGNYYLIGIAVLLLLLEIEFFILKSRENKKSRYLKLPYPSGRVLLSIPAIEEFVEKVSMGFPEICSVDPIVTSAGKQLRIILNLSLTNGYKATQVAQDIEKTIRSQIQHILGIEKSVTVEVHVTKIEETKTRVFEDKVFQGIETP